MPSQKNVSAVKDLESKLMGAQAVYLADYAGLTVKEQTMLRDKVREAGGELVIAKNRLLKIAIKNTLYEQDGLPREFEEFLRGPSATLFATGDPIAPLKALVDFAKKQEQELPKVKSGILDKKVLSITEVLQLAALPSRQELLAKLLSTLSNPARNLVSVLSAPTRNLVYALSAIKERK